MELHEYLEDGNEGSTFEVDSEQKANWVLRKMKTLEDRRKANSHLALDEIEKVNAWLSEVNGSLDRDLEHFQTLLLSFAEKMKEENPKFKSLKLPNGKFVFRKQQSKWNYDESALLASLKQQGYSDLIRIKEEANKAEIKKRFKVAEGKVIDSDTGEVLDGITVEDRPDELKIETI